MKLQGRLGSLGYGNMGSAIIEALVREGIVAAEQVAVHDPEPERQEAARALGLDVAPLPEALAACDVLLLAVKPQTMGDALATLKPHFEPERTLVISIAAGIPIRFLRARLGDAARVIRVMPNTPSLVGAGAACIAAGPGCNEADLAAARTIFSAVGIAEETDESLMDAVTAVSGSGPAYFFYMVECLIAAGEAEGLPRSLAEKLARQTLLGAGRLLAESGESAETLRARVTSPGGTTAAALSALEARDYQGVIADAVHAAAARGRELGKAFE